MSRFTIRVGDRLPWLAYKFDFSLQTALSVTFSAQAAGAAAPFIDRQAAIIANGTYIIDGVSTPLTPASGVVFYPWTAGDTAAERQDVSGLFHINWPGNLQETLPSDAVVPITIKLNY
jgi:hypothetical protein